VGGKFQKDYVRCDMTISLFKRANWSFMKVYSPKGCFARNVRYDSDLLKGADQLQDSLGRRDSR
jgi:hypothetical protein